MNNENEKSILKSNRFKIIYTGIILGFVFAYFSGYLGHKYMGETKAQRLLHLKQSVQMARNSIEPILMEYRSQNISMDNALRQIRSLIRQMVYDDSIGKNYIFMSSYDGIMLVQPFEPEKEMTDVWDLKDYYGVYIIRSLVKAAQSKEGQGYVSYHYQRPGQAAAQEKISFVMGIPELKCYIGTGQYMDDLYKRQTIYITKIAVLTLLLLFLLFLLVRASMREIHTQNKILKKTECELDAIFHNTFQFIGTLSVDGKLTKINRSALDFIEQDETSVTGKPYWNTPGWQDDGSKARLKEAILNCAKGEFSRFDVTYIRPNQNRHFIDFSLTPIFDEKGKVTFLLAEGRDMTEQIKVKKEKKKLEAILHQSQKMEAMGTLAGGIAHDFNNILGAILGFSELIKGKLSPEDSSREMQDQIINAAIRARDLVQQILLFSRQSEQELKPLQPGVVIKETIQLLRSTIPATIEIKQDIPDGLGAILADPTQIHQIIMNLCTNAYHAMKEKGGVIGICLSEKKILNHEYFFSELKLDPGSYLFFEISDTGHGMDKATLNKVFDPYFTTKKTGEGTGLGLSVVHGIVKNCGGEIRIYSEPGQGTNVHIYFPKLKAGDQSLAAPQETILLAGTEQILLADDDPAILDMLRQSIENLGYQVTAVQGSLEAFDEFSRAPTKYDMVITDMNMPHMSGFELSKQIFKRAPNMPILLCTGYSELITKEKAEAIGIKAFIMKPVLREVLSRTIREVLDRQ